MPVDTHSGYVSGGDMRCLSFSGQSSHPRTGSRYGSYLCVHRGARYFRVTVPVPLQSILGKKEIRRSLDGLDSRSARTRAVRLALAAHTFFALIEDIRDGRIRLRQDDSAQSLGIVSEVAKKLDTVWFEAAHKQELSPGALALRLPSFLREVGLEAEEKKPGKKRGRAPSLISGKTLKPEPQLSGTPLTSGRINEKMRAESASDVLTRRRGRSAKGLPTLSESAAAYVKAKKFTWSKSSAKDIPPQVRQFVEIVREQEQGRDIDIDQLTREHIRIYHDTLKNLPFRINGKTAYQDKPWLKLAEMGRSGKVERLLARKTLEVRQINVRSFINWCELEYRGAIQARYLNSGFPKVLADKDIRRKGVKRESFSSDELSALLGNREGFLQATQGEASRFWSPWIALYSGMRIEEICQLTLADIRKIDEVLCFSVNEENADSPFDKHVKTSAGIRNIPIHPWLWNEGAFKHFVNLRQNSTPKSHWASTLLFPDMQERVNRIDLESTKLSASVTKWFTRYRRSVGVGGQKGETSPKTFHSFRHTVIEFLHKKARVDLSMVQTVVGHELSDMGETETYAGVWSMKTLRDEVIMKLCWHTSI